MKCFSACVSELRTGLVLEVPSTSNINKVHIITSEQGELPFRIEGVLYDRSAPGRRDPQAWVCVHQYTAAVCHLVCTWCCALLFWCVTFKRYFWKKKNTERSIFLQRLFSAHGYLNKKRNARSWLKVQSIWIRRVIVYFNPARFVLTSLQFDPIKVGFFAYVSLLNRWKQYNFRQEFAAERDAFRTSKKTW